MNNFYLVSAKSAPQGENILKFFSRVMKAFRNFSFNSPEIRFCQS